MRSTVSSARSVAVAALAGLVLSAPAVAPAQDTVDWQDAATCVGRVCGLRGTVADAQDDGPVIRLYFDAARRDVYVTLVRGWFVTWPDYAGHAIVATGPVDQFRSATEVIVRDPGAVEVLDAPLTPTPPEETATAAPLATSTAAPTLAPTSAPTLAPPLVPTVPPTLVPTSVAPAVAPPAVPAAAATAASEDAEQLRQRVRELEERVRQLEGAH
ncbi:MAG: hypothetical protein ABI629_05510 [bacterium]